MNVHEFAELSAGHALGALSADEERAFQEALAAHPEWSAILDADVETAAALADGAGAVEPPADIRAQLMSRVRASVAETRAVDTVPVEDATLGATPERADVEPTDPAEALT
ncbi:MAG: anti-sigma factor, partial [Microbacterium sp.]